MKRAGEIALAGGRELLAVKEDLFLRGKVDFRAHLIGLLRPAPQIDVAGDDRPGSISDQIHVAEVHDGTIDREPRLHVRAERLVRLDLHCAVRERRAPEVVGRNRRAKNQHVQVTRGGAPGSPVIFVRERAPQGGYTPERRREAARSLAGRLPGELGKVVATVGKCLDHHVPVGHGDRLDDELPAEDSPPRDLNGDLLRRQEGSVLRCKTFDHEILDHEHAGSELCREPADVHRPLDELRAFTLRPAAQLRTQIDGEQRDEPCGHDRCDDREHGPQRADQRTAPADGRRLDRLDPIGRRRGLLARRLRRWLVGVVGHWADRLAIRLLSERGRPRPTRPRRPKRP